MTGGAQPSAVLRALLHERWGALAPPDRTDPRATRAWRRAAQHERRGTPNAVTQSEKEPANRARVRAG